MEIQQQDVVTMTRNEEHFLGRQLTEKEHSDILARIAFNTEHKGHSQQHLTMFYIMVAALVASQLVITLWKRAHLKSYNLATLLGLWLVPFLMALHAQNIRFVLVWIVFSLLNSYIVRLAFKTPMHSSSPRIVYSWYTHIYDISYALCIAGYAVTLTAFFHLPALIFGLNIQQESAVFVSGILMMFYAVYFGTLSMDFVDRLSERMATSVGYYSETGIPSKYLRENVCAICGDNTANISNTEQVQVLECKHSFHLGCIKLFLDLNYRGWTIIGKKDTCPYCKEVVDLKVFKSNPWDNIKVIYFNSLNWVRFVLVWNPIIFLVVHSIYSLFNLK